MQDWVQREAQGGLFSCLTLYMLCRMGQAGRDGRAEPEGVWGDTAKRFAEQRVFTHGPPAKGGLVLIFLDIEESIGP